MRKRVGLERHEDLFAARMGTPKSPSSARAHRGASHFQLASGDLQITCTARAAARPTPLHSRSPPPPMLRHRHALPHRPHRPQVDLSHRDACGLRIVQPSHNFAPGVDHQAVPVALALLVVPPRLRRRHHPAPASGVRVGGGGCRRHVGGGHPPSAVHVPSHVHRPDRPGCSEAAQHPRRLTAFRSPAPAAAPPSGPRRWGR